MTLKPAQERAPSTPPGRELSWNRLKRAVYRTLGRPEGALGIWLIGHREYVGGLWDEIGKLQFEFLKSKGLAPHHVLLDVACGSLRAGAHFIRYLNRGNYIGLDKERRLIEWGLESEVGHPLIEEKAPEFVVSDSFEFSKFGRKPDFALAQSLFTHLNADDIRRCLLNLRACMDPGSRFYATYVLVPEASYRRDLRRSQAHRAFRYTLQMAENFGASCGWSAHYIGDWSHPRGQVMMEYIAA